MGSSAPTAPTPPDPYKTAGAQAGQNVQSAIANSYLGNVDQYGPYGSTTYSQTGDFYDMTGPDGRKYKIPRFAQTTTLSPEQQQLYEQQTRIGTSLNDLALSQTQRLADHLGRPIDASGLPQVSSDVSADRQRVEQALFDRLNPQLDRDRTALENTLVNQGFQRGTEAFTNAMDQFNRQVNDQRLAVTARGLQEHQGLAGMEQANRQRALQEMLALRNQPINEISALMGGGQVHLPSAQGYQGGNIAAADVAGSVYNTAALQQKQYEQQMGLHRQHVGGLYDLGKTALGGLMPRGSPKWGE
jgi:hypothetical protein